MRKIISVIIPTYGRGKALIETLESLNNQTVLPDEVIIVDESPQDIRKLLRSSHFRFPIKYIWNPSKFRSLARSRNVGKKMAKGDIVLFLDDDVILEPDFIERILGAFRKHPHLLGAMGQITNTKKCGLFYQVLNLMFLRNLQYKPKVRRSFISSYPYEPKEEFIPTEWLSGSNMAYKRKVLERYDFDWRLLKYSYSEDVDFSYSLYQQYKRKVKMPLAMVSSARLVHKQSPAGRLLGFSLEAHRRVVNLYMLYKHFGDTPVNILVFLWWNLGEILEYLFSGLLRGRMRNNLKNIRMIVKATKFALFNLDIIRKGHILKLQQI